MDKETQDKIGRLVELENKENEIKEINKNLYTFKAEIKQKILNNEVVLFVLLSRN